MSVVRIIKLVSVKSGLILEKIYELFVGTNETVRVKRVSVEPGFHCSLLSMNCFCGLIELLYLFHLFVF